MQPFYPASQFLWADHLQQNWQHIQRELLDIINLPASHQPGKNWLAAHPAYVKSDNEGIRWKTYEFLFFGIRQPAHIRVCPKTWQFLQQVPELVTAQFSMLEPHAHIQPHKGFTRMVLRAHLPLIVPASGDMGLKVAGETRRWHPGNLLVFDDSLEHEAWNHSSEKRAVLMFDFAKPDGGYTAHQICRYKLERTDDPFLLAIAPANVWVSWLEQGEFPVAP
jgi:beta-hydroxylase